MRFREFDVYTPLQEDMIEQYDVDSIRLLVFAVKSGDPTHFIQQAWSKLSETFLSRESGYIVTILILFVHAEPVGSFQWSGKSKPFLRLS